MVKEQEREVEMPGIEPRAFGFPCQCSATELQLPLATIPQQRQQAAEHWYGKPKALGSIPGRSTILSCSFTISKVHRQ